MPLTQQQAAALAASPSQAVVTSQPAPMPAITPGVPLEHDTPPPPPPPPGPSPRLEAPEAIPGPQAALRPTQWEASTWIPVQRVDGVPMGPRRRRRGEPGELQASVVIEVRDKGGATAP